MAAELARLEVAALAGLGRDVTGQDLLAELAALDQLYQAAQTEAVEGRAEVGLGLLLRFCGEGLVVLPRHPDFGHTHRSETTQRLNAALLRIAGLRRRALANFTKEGEISEAERAVLAELCGQRLRLWEGSAGPAEEALGRLCATLASAHRAQHGKELGTQAASLGLAAGGLGVAVATSGPLFPAAIALAAVGVSLASYLGDKQVQRMRERARKETNAALLQLWLLTPSLLGATEALAQPLLEELAGLSLPPDTAAAEARSWRYRWWRRPATSEDEAGSLCPRDLVCSVGGGLGGAASELLTLPRLSEKTKAAGISQAGLASHSGLAFSTIISGWAAAESIAALRKGDAEGQGFLSLQPEMERVKLYTKAVLAAAAEASGSLSEARKTSLAGAILSAKFRCTKCWRVGVPVGCEGCGGWLACAHCVAELACERCCDAVDEDLAALPPLTRLLAQQLQWIETHLGEAVVPAMPLELLPAPGGPRPAVWEASVGLCRRVDEELESAVRELGLAKLGVGGRGRRLVRRGHLLKLTHRGAAKPCRVLLTDRVLVCAKDGALDGLRSPGLLPLAQLRLEDAAEATDFRLSDDAKAWTFRAKDQEQRDLWADSISKTISILAK